MYAGNGGKPIWNDFQTPLGRMIHCYHDKPSVVTNEKTNKPIIEEQDGVQYQKAEFKIAMMWPKAFLDTQLIPMRQLAAVTRDQAWGEAAAQDQWFRLQPFIRDGDNPEHNTKKREYLFGQVYLNFKAKATPVIVDRKHTGAYTGAPGIIGPWQEDLMPLDVYPGCWGRVSGIMFGTEYSGKNFISVRLNNIQKGGGPNNDGNDERIGGGARPSARDQFDPLMAGDPPAGTIQGYQAKPDPFAGLGGMLGGGTPPAHVRTNIV